MEPFVSNESTTVQTTKGLIRGYYHNGLYMFKGVPYAQAQRFHQPEPVDPWDGVFDATNYGYVCPLLEMPKPNGEQKVPHRYWLMDENCMNLNVWTPALDDAKRPVLVWFHGGGLEAGSSIEQIAYEGENLAKWGDLVVVSVNHRLNILGYLDLSDYGEEYENSGNIGTADTVKSLEWVRDNIAKFGGDPDNVTIFGQSGGGVKTTLLMQYPEADGLFHKVVNMSGVVDDLLCDADDTGKELAAELMSILGCETVEQLMEVDYNTMAGVFNDLRPVYEAKSRHVGCLPKPNSHYVGLPAVVGWRKETADIPVMVGSVFGEFTGFAAPAFDRENISFFEGVDLVRQTYGDDTDQLVELFIDAYPDRNPADILYLDTIFRPGDINYVRGRSELNNATFSYLFDEDFFIDGKCVPWHCSDIPYWFGNTELVPVCMKEGVEKLEDEMFNALVQFARTGDPNHSRLANWKPSEPGKEYTMMFCSNTHLVENHDHQLIEAVLEANEKHAQGEVDMENIQH